LLDLDFGHPISQNIFPEQPPPPTRTAASGSIQLDPWGTPSQHQNTMASNDPWGGPQNAMGSGSSASNVHIPTNSDPWSPVQQNLASAATGAIPRTSPGIGLDNGTKVPDLHRNTIGNDPWNAVGASSTIQNNSHQLDAFSGLQTNINSGINGKSGLLSTANNDPWGTTHTNTSERPQEGQSMDPFSPVAQSQLAEFDIIRDQMDNSSKNTGMRAEGNGRGTTSPNPFDMGGMSSGVGAVSSIVTKSDSSHTGAKPKSTVQTLLGEHSNLVNLDDLVTSGKQQVRNPFEQQPPNPFQAAKAPRPAMNDLLQQKSSSSWSQQPSQTNQQTDLNPFF